MVLNDKNEIKNFRLDFAEAVKDLEEQYNIKINLKTITCSLSEFHTTMTVTTADEEERADHERAKFKLLAPRYGFTADDFMCEVKGKKGKTYELIGFNTKAPKNPCLLREIGSDAMASCPPDYVRAYKVNNDFR